MPSMTGPIQLYVNIVFYILLTLGACARGVITVVVSVCVHVCPGKISFHVRLHQPVIVPTVYDKCMLGFQRVDFAKSAWVKSYNDH